METYRKSSLVYGNKTFINLIDISEQLNTYFLNVGPNLASNMDADPFIPFVVSQVTETQFFTLQA